MNAVRCFLGLGAERVFGVLCGCTGVDPEPLGGAFFWLLDPLVILDVHRGLLDKVFWRAKGVSGLERCTFVCSAWRVDARKVQAAGRL